MAFRRGPQFDFRGGPMGKCACGPPCLLDPPSDPNGNQELNRAASRRLRCCETLCVSDIKHASPAVEKSPERKAQRPSSDSNFFSAAMDMVSNKIIWRPLLNHIDRARQHVSIGLRFPGSQF